MMNKISKSDIPLIIICLIQIFSLFTISTLWGRIVALISIVLCPIITIYYYKKNKISKQRFVFSLIVTVSHFIVLLLQLLSVYYPEINFRIIRIARRIGILVMTTYVWITNENKAVD